MESTSPALEQWKQTVAQLRGPNRKNTNPQLMKQYAAVLQELILDRTAPLDLIVPDLTVLPNGVVGMALGAIPKGSASERRNPFLTWISHQDQERGDAERAYALPGLFAAAADEAFQALRSMKSGKNKELKERLASLLADIDAEQIARIFSDQKEHEIRKVILLLLATAQESKADRRTRAALLEGVVPTIVRLGIHTGSLGADVRNHLESVIRSLDAIALRQVRESLQTKAPEALRDLFGALPPQAVSEEPIAGPIEPAATEVGPCKESPKAMREPSVEKKPVVIQSLSAQQPTKIPVTPDPLAWFDANIQMLAHAREYYLAARREAEVERKRREEAETQAQEATLLREKLGGAETRIHQLELERVETMRQRDIARDALKTVTDNLDEERRAQRAKERQQADEKGEFERERQALQRRVDVNAEARLNDFRLAVGAALMPMIRDVPMPGSPGANELGPGLLICIDQMVRALAEKGVDLRRKVGEQR
jgi:hypothetical protein